MSVFNQDYPLSNAAAGEILGKHRDETDAKLRGAAEEALQADPHSVEAFLTLGDLADSTEQRVEQYRHASEAAAHREPHLVSAYMPKMRLYMATRLASEARLADAAEILQCALQEDPRDGQGIRWPLSGMMLQLGWDDDLLALLQPFQDDAVGTTPWALALLRFRQESWSEEADGLLFDADDLNPHVFPFLAGMEPLPPERPAMFQAGSEEEAAMIAQHLLPAWRGTPSAMQWLRESLEDSYEEDDFDSEDPLSVALELPRGTTDWRLQMTTDRDSGTAVVAIVDDQAELVGFQTFEESPSAHELRNFVIDSFAEPNRGQPRKPRRLCVPTKALVQTLQKTCGTVDVDIAQKKTSAEEKKQLAQLVKMLSAGQSDIDEADLQSLPQHQATWLYGLFNPPLWISDRATPRRGWMQLVLDATDGQVVGTEVDVRRPTPTEMATYLKRTMACPGSGKPRRPQQCLLDPGDATDLERTAFEDQGMAVGQLHDGDVFTELVADMLTGNGPTERSLYEAVEGDQHALEAFYQAAARFFRAAPWRMVPGDQFVELRCEGWRNTVWTACVIGQMGQELGVALYPDPEFVQQILRTGEMDTSSMQSLVTHFDEAFKAIPVDVWMLERHGWPVANSEAYPFVARFDPGPELHCPTAAELQILETAMTHLPRFLSMPPGESLSIDKPHRNQPQTLTMRWVE